MMTLTLTLLALFAFAANSVLCRIALGQQYIDPAGFTIIRLLSGSIALYLILMFHQYANKKTEPIALQQKVIKGNHSKGSWLASMFLFVYALSFSYGYGYLDTGTGALILFGAVQICMVLSVLLRKQKLLNVEWVGLALACVGFFYLMYPELTKPSLLGFILMITSGVAWAGYTLIGKSSISPLIDTCYNFFRTIPFVMLLALVTLTYTEYSYNGVLLAVLSGALMSGVGYAIWYAAVRRLTATIAAVVQLLVPVIATLGGIVFMNEVMTIRFQVSTIMILGGIALVLLTKQVINSKTKGNVKEPL